MTREFVLLVDDEEHLRVVGEQSFELADVEVSSFARAVDALKHISPEFEGVLVTDIRMPELDGVALLQKVMEIDPEIPVIMVTGHGDIDLAVECIKYGAYDFIEKPWQPERLVASVRRAFVQRQLVLENRALREDVANANAFKSDLFGRSPKMTEARKVLASIAQTDVNVLITGNTGTGKEVAARSLHRKSARKRGPFVHINCAALPEALIESELFGYEAGAFPGAMRARSGKLEHARGGILCLDEVDLLSLDVQAKLLDVLENRAVTRLGSNDRVDLDFRVVALSKCNLEDAVSQGQFRSDLYYRLNVASLHLPDLKDRREDIPKLFMLLAAQSAHKNRLPLPENVDDVLISLSARDWPGNVRELRNEAERFVLGLSQIIDAEPDAQTLANQVAAYEKALISASISAHDGRIKQTYESLGLSRRSLYDKLAKYGISRADFTDDD